MRIACPTVWSASSQRVGEASGHGRNQPYSSRADVPGATQRREGRRRNRWWHSGQGRMATTGRPCRKWQPRLIRGLDAGGGSFRGDCGSIKGIQSRIPEILTKVPFSYAKITRCLCYTGSQISRAVSPSVTFPCRLSCQAGSFSCCGTRATQYGSV